MQVAMNNKSVKKYGFDCANNQSRHTQPLEQ
ncbi:MAG: hypothetical protein DELT_02221 [Desulfovibrio sp.]